MKLDSYLSGFLLVVGGAGLAILGLIVVRKALRAKTLISSHHDVGGYLLSVIGTMYAVILGLIVVDSMNKFQQARQTTEQESNALADLILLSNQLPTRERDLIRTLATSYADRVIADEWPAMERGQHAPEARRAAIRLIDAVCHFEPRTESEKAIYAAELTAVCEFWNNRRSRTNTAAHGVASLVWVVLIVGGVITVSFTYFFRLDHLKVQVAMTGLVAAIITLNIFLVLMFGYPFSGELKVDPDSFRVPQAIIEHQTSTR